MFTYHKPSQRQLNYFGWGAALLLAALGAWSLFRGTSAAPFLFGASAVFAALTLFARSVLQSVYRVWMYFGMTLGWINLHILMALTLYLLFTPIRGIQKLLGRDPLKRTLEPNRESYFTERAPLDKKHFERMY